MGGEVVEGPIDERFVATRPGHRALQIIRDEDRRTALEVFQHPGVDPNPIDQRLAGDGFGIGEARGAEHPDEQFDGNELAGFSLDDVQPFAGEVFEQLLAGTVMLAHRGRELAPPAPVKLAELAVAIPVRMALEILKPQQLQRHARALELAVDGREVRRGSGGAGDQGTAEKPRLEGRVVELLGQRPAKPRLAGALQIQRHRGRPHRAGLGDLAVPQPRLVLELQNLT